jgi:hypothetical protein
MIILKILTILYVIHFFKKTNILKNMKEREKVLIYVLLIIISFLDTQVRIFNYSFDFLIIGIAIVIFEIIFKYLIVKRLKIENNFIFLKAYGVILLLLLVYRGVIWILQQL